jgi:hypothetical protein
LRIFSPLPALMRSRLALMFAYKPGPGISLPHAASGSFGLRRTFAPRTNSTSTFGGGGGSQSGHRTHPPDQSATQPLLLQLRQGFRSVSVMPQV